MVIAKIVQNTAVGWIFSGVCLANALIIINKRENEACSITDTQDKAKGLRGKKQGKRSEERPT